jgi:hypothetical protein
MDEVYFPSRDSCWHPDLVNVSEEIYGSDLEKNKPATITRTDTWKVNGTSFII